MCRQFTLLYFSQSDFKDKLPGVHHSRIPQWVLPAVPARKLAGLRPDLLILRRNIDSLRPDSNNIGAYIVEIKVTNDTSSDKMAERMRLQHKSLLRKFVRHNWTKIQLIPLVLGASGQVPLATVTNLKTLGVSGDSLDRLLSNIHTCLINSAHSMVVERRRIESSQARTP